MPQKDNKQKYTDKQKRMAQHIEETYREKGDSEENAEAKAWATVNKQMGGGEKKGGSGQQVGAAEEHKRRSDSAKRGWETRRKKERA